MPKCGSCNSSTTCGCNSVYPKNMRFMFNGEPVLQWTMEILWDCILSSIEQDWSCGYKRILDFPCIRIDWNTIETYNSQWVIQSIDLWQFWTDIYVNNILTDNWNLVLQDNDSTTPDLTIPLDELGCCNTGFWLIWTMLTLNQTNGDSQSIDLASIVPSHTPSSYTTNLDWSILLDNWSGWTLTIPAPVAHVPSSYSFGPNGELILSNWVDPDFTYTPPVTTPSSYSFGNNWELILENWVDPAFVYTAPCCDASETPYDNGSSQSPADNVQEAIDHIYQNICVGDMFTVNAGTTNSASDNSLWEEAMACWDILHFWSSDSTINIGVTPWSAIVDLKVDFQDLISWDNGNTIALWSDGKLFVNVPAHTPSSYTANTDWSITLNNGSGWSLVIPAPIPDTTIYDRDGTLTGNRTVTMAGNDLSLTGWDVKIGTAWSDESNLELTWLDGSSPKRSCDTATLLWYRNWDWKLVPMSIFETTKFSPAVTNQPIPLTASNTTWWIVVDWNYTNSTPCTQHLDFVFSTEISRTTQAWGSTAMYFAQWVQFGVISWVTDRYDYTWRWYQTVNQMSSWLATAYSFKPTPLKLKWFILPWDSVRIAVVTAWQYSSWLDLTGTNSLVFPFSEILVTNLPNEHN